MNVKIIRLITGDDLVCELGPSSSEDEVIIIKPIMVGMSESGIAMAPWFITAKSESFIIQRQHVLTQAEPVPELKNKYVEIVGGIVLPESSIITPVH